MITQMSIGIDSFSYHRYFGEITPWEKPVDIRWQTEDFLGRAASLGVDQVSLQTAYLPPLMEGNIRQVERDLRAQFERSGFQPVLAWGHRSGLEGGTNSRKVEDLHRWLKLGGALGGSLMRIVGGDQLSWFKPVTDRITRLTPVLREACLAAQAAGMTLAIENHADFAIRDLVRLVESVGTDNFGICFD